MGDVTHYAGDQCPGGHYEETTVSDERCEPCTGGDYCGRTTNGYFENGTHGPGWYCGWCAAVPDAS